MSLPSGCDQIGRPWSKTTCPCGMKPLLLHLNQTSPGGQCCSAHSFPLLAQFREERFAARNLGPGPPGSGTKAHFVPETPVISWPVAPQVNYCASNTNCNHM